MTLSPNKSAVLYIGDMSDKSLDEARFNLATHIMSNGVELIIASDRVKHSDKVSSIPSSSSQLLQTQTQETKKKKPVTFAPSTLINHMILALPTAKQDKFTIPIIDNQFITKTCLTTYTYHTTYLFNGSTTVESAEKVVSNRHTEERNYLRASTHLPMGLTLLNTPELVVGIFPTTYHYFNKMRNNDLVLTSSYTIINTVTGPEDYISFLQPSEEATPLQETNTYYSRLSLTKSIQDAFESTKILTDESILTQVVIESVVTDIVPSSVLSSELVSIFRHELMQKNVKNNRKVLITLATLLNGQTLNVTAVSIPKGSLAPTTSSLKLNQNAMDPSITIRPSSVENDLSDTETDSETEAETESEDGLNLAESEIKDVYIRPLKNIPPPSPSPSHSPSSNVEQLIGSLNLQRFRPVFNVMADLLQKNLVSRQPPEPVYQHSLLNKGIPIRPGEIINANANDIIIGKPNGIGAQFSLSRLEYHNKSAQNQNQNLVYLQPSPLKKKSWTPSMIPLSLIPPQVIPLAEGSLAAYDQDGFNRVFPDDDYKTITILRPPSQVLNSYSKHMSSSVASEYLHQSAPGVAASITYQLRSPMSYNKQNYNFNSHIYGSEQQIANLNSELKNNEILEIKQIPQIFINFKLDVLSHNVNMNVPPLTFKRDNENFPVATAVQGQIPVPPMPLVKIPLNKAHVEVRLSPQSTQLAVEPPYDDEHYKSSSPQSIHSDVCNPSCKSSKNEICVHISGFGSRCECRLGFARIFPDRPCKPTYTYEMSVPASRVGSYLLKFNHEFLNNSSSQYRHLSSIILDAIDRMVMQSDFRDEYYGVQLKEFTSANNGAVIGKFLLQLSENSDENRLENVFKKYLRQSNYSIGGTELYTSKEHINSLTIQDFNECGNRTFNDCAMHAQCFNLVGSYTCICPDGYADLSDNPIYPGRHCSDKLIGCDKCNYHGNCITQSLNGTAVCECFAWYTGITCQLNLKILLICIIVIVTVFVVLLVCMLLIYSRRKVHGDSLTSPIFITASNYHHPSLLTASRKMSPADFFQERSIDKHAILNDSNSDSSHISEPYSYKKSIDVANTSKGQAIKSNIKSGKTLNKFREKVNSNHYESKGPNEPINRSTFSNIDMTQAEQSDRSLTVMIPRARYFHPTVLPKAQMTMDEIDKSRPKSRSQSQQNVTYNDNNASTRNVGTIISDSSEMPQKSGALVSAGFEVSAIVSDRVADLKGNENENKPITLSPKAQQISRSNLEAILRSGEEIQRMSSWMSNIQTNAISADVRSFDETTVQAVTKSMHLCFDMQTQSTINEEPNTMTERDIGSTFLLPHTHLYMPEKLESELSGFDSI
ncbi:uncharacterized protein LOC117783719 [Drosophila innubila]|uniref:uncharacterized protein LOC117783719 n=1 Tax=Drosophila innubila TaxID=198719 RepID=UPI00148CC6AF|nr:uncharacterized protein LOC117783719 [Drosophila innubila]